jgi:lipoprotein-anchoring transpeptidase ErfK/SrfK
MWKAAQVILWAPAASNLFHGSKDTLFRIHGTNQPERRSHFVGLTNKEVIDLHQRMKIGRPMVVLSSSAQ